MVRPIIVCTESSVNFRQHIEAIVQAEKGELIRQASAAKWADALDRWFPALALIDLDYVDAEQARHPEKPIANPDDEGWQLHLRRIKLRPHTRYIPIVAFSREDELALEQARQLNADHVERYDDLIPKLAGLINRTVSPPVRYPEGWDEPLPSLARDGLRLFNERDYFEQHELLEEAWRAEAKPIRDLYQGILQIGVAFYQIELGNWKGAIKMFRRGLPKLRDLPPRCQGISLSEFRNVAEEIHVDVTTLGPSGLADFDQKRFPQIDY